MTAAHTAVLRKLYDLSVLNVAIRRGVAAPGEYGDVEFGTATITVDRDLDFDEWLHTVAHELVHLERGPFRIGDEAREERIVAEETARLLVPSEALPSILEAAKPGRIAAELGVDEKTVQLAIDLTRQEYDAARGADEGTA